MRATKTGEDIIKEMLHGEIDQLNEDMALRLKEGYVQKVEEFNERTCDVGHWRHRPERGGCVGAGREH